MKIRMAALLLIVSLACGSAMASVKTSPAQTQSQSVSVGGDETNNGWGLIWDLIKKLMEQVQRR